MKILVIEDDAETAEYVARGLEQEGHVVDRATNGEDGMFLAGSEPYDLMIIDRMLPGLDGLTIVKRIRSASVHTPVLFLTTRSSTEDRVAGLDAGGDDYLVKPFAFAELVARVAALGRRPRTAFFGRTLKVGDLELNQASRVVTRGESSSNYSRASTGSSNISCSMRDKSSRARCCCSTSGISTSIPVRPSSKCISAAFEARSTRASTPS